MIDAPTSSRPTCFRPGVKYGLDHERSARIPDLIVAAISGYGLGGDEAIALLDDAAYWARTGMMDVMREEACRRDAAAWCRDTRRPRTVVAILAALRMRDATGIGRTSNCRSPDGLYILAALATALVGARPIAPRPQATTTPLEQLPDERRPLADAV